LYATCTFNLFIILHYCLWYLLHYLLFCQEGGVLLHKVNCCFSYIAILSADILNLFVRLCEDGCMFYILVRGIYEVRSVIMWSLVVWQNSDITLRTVLLLIFNNSKFNIVKDLIMNPWWLIVLMVVILFLFHCFFWILIVYIYNFRNLNARTTIKLFFNWTFCDVTIINDMEIHLSDIYGAINVNLGWMLNFVS